MKNTKLALITGLAIAAVGISAFTSQTIAGFMSREVVLQNGLTGNILGNAGKDVVRVSQDIAFTAALTGLMCGTISTAIALYLLRKSQLNPSHVHHLYLDEVLPNEIQEFRAWRGLKASQEIEMRDVVRHGNHRDD